MSDLPLRYDAVETDRRSELNLLDKATLIEKIIECESQVIFDHEVLVDEVTALVEAYETRRRVIDFVEANHADDDEVTRKRLARDLLVFVDSVRP